MSGHDTDDRLLAAILEGEVDATRGDVARRLAADPALHERLASMRDAARGLDVLGAEARDVLSSAPRGDDASLPGEERVRPTLERLVGAPASRSAPRLAWAAAAALLVALAAALAYRSGGPEAPAPIRLGGAIPLTAPVGETGAFDAFTWNAPLPEDAGCAFVVRVYAEGEPARPLLESPRLDRPTWSPTAEERAALPDAIRWEVHVVDALDRSRTFGEAWAVRRAR